MYEGEPRFERRGGVLGARPEDSSKLRRADDLVRRHVVLVRAELGGVRRGPELLLAAAERGGARHQLVAGDAKRLVDRVDFHDMEGPTSNGSSRPRDRAAAVAAASGRVSCRANSVASPRTRTATATMVPPHSQSDCWTCAWMVAIGAFTPTPQPEYLLLAKACRTSAPSKLVVSYARRRRASSRSRPGTRVPTSRPSSRAFATISPLPSQIVEFHCDGSPCPSATAGTPRDAARD